MANHGSPVPLLHYQIAKVLHTLNVLWFQKRGAQILLSLKVLGKRKLLQDP